MFIIINRRLSADHLSHLMGGWGKIFLNFVKISRNCGEIYENFTAKYKIISGSRMLFCSRGNSVQRTNILLIHFFVFLGVKPVSFSLFSLGLRKIPRSFRNFALGGKDWGRVTARKYLIGR